MQIFLSLSNKLFSVVLYLKHGDHSQKSYYDLY